MRDPRDFPPPRTRPEITEADGQDLFDLVDSGPADPTEALQNPAEPTVTRQPNRQWPPEITVSYKSLGTCLECGEELFVEPGPTQLPVHLDGIMKCPFGDTWARAAETPPSRRRRR